MMVMAVVAMVVAVAPVAAARAAQELAAARAVQELAAPCHSCTCVHRESTMAASLRLQSNNTCCCRCNHSLSRA
jgi:hypothetical protein